MGQLNSQTREPRVFQMFKKSATCTRQPERRSKRLIHEIEQTAGVGAWQRTGRRGASHVTARCWRSKCFVPSEPSDRPEAEAGHSRHPQTNHRADTLVV